MEYNIKNWGFFHWIALHTLVNGNLGGILHCMANRSDHDCNHDWRLIWLAVVIKTVWPMFRMLWPPLAVHSWLSCSRQAYSQVRTFTHNQAYKAGGENLHKPTTQQMPFRFSYIHPASHIPATLIHGITIWCNMQPRSNGFFGHKVMTLVPGI